MVKDSNLIMLSLKNQRNILPIIRSKQDHTTPFISNYYNAAIENYAQIIKYNLQRSWKTITFIKWKKLPGISLFQEILWILPSILLPPTEPKNALKH